MGIDIGVAVVGTDRGYLDEVKARLRENDMLATVKLGPVAVDQ